MSRVLGYFRDMLVAHAFGAGLAADAFYAAYRIPNLLRRLFGEGALSASFIPIMSEYLHCRTKEETQKLINSLFTALIIILSVLSVLGILFAPWLVKLIAYGFTSDPEKLALTINLTKLMFPFLLFICLAALALGILNTLGSFFIPAIAPASLSVSEILYVVAIAPLLSDTSRITGLALSVIIGGALQFIVQWPQIKKLGWKLQFSVDFKNPGLKRIAKLMAPATLGISVDQINAFVDTICASFLLQGSITALYYSNRIVQMPYAVFGLALSSVAFPAMSKAAAENNVPAMKETLNFSMRFIIFILVPAATALMILGYPIIKVLFERGSFTGQATLLTASALIFYSLGLPAFAFAKLLASAFYSFKNTKTPVKIAVISMVINIALNIILMGPMGVGGLALATAVSSWFNAAALAYLLRKKIGLLGISKIIATTLKTAAASAVMGALCWALAYRVFVSMPFTGLFVSIAAGVTAYFLLAILFRIEERKPLLNIILREKPAELDD